MSFVEQQMDKLQREARDLAQAAKSVYDSWDQVDGVSDWYGEGGICDDVADEMCKVLRRAGFDCFTQYNQYETHTAAFVYWEDEVDDYGEQGVLIKVDIHPSHYEEGYGYKWTKIEGAKFDASILQFTDMSDVYENYV